MPTALELILKIAGDSSGAQAAGVQVGHSLQEIKARMKDVQGAAAQVTMALRSMGPAAVTSGAPLVAQLKEYSAEMQHLQNQADAFSVKLITANQLSVAWLRKMHPEIQQAIDDQRRLGAAQIRSAGGFRQAVRSNLGDLRALRMAMYSTIGLVSFGYIISEWGRVAQAIQNAALSLGGFDAGLREILADTAKMNEKLLTTFGQLTVNQEQMLARISDPAKRRIAELQMEIAAAKEQQATSEKQRQGIGTALDMMRQFHDLQRKQTAESNQTAGAAIAGASPFVVQTKVQASMMKLLQDAKQKGIDISGDLLTTEKSYIAAMKGEQGAARALVKLQTELGDARLEASKKSDVAAQHADTAAAHELSAAEKWQTYLQRAQDRMMKAAQQGMALQARAAAQEQSFIEKSTRETDRLMQRLDALQAKQQRAQRITPSEQKQLSVSPEGAASFNPAADSLGAAAARSVPPLTAQRQAVLALNDALAGTHTSMQKFSGEAGIASLASDKFSKGMGAAITQAVVYGDSIGKAMERAAKAVLASLAEQAAVKALYSLATYFLDIAIHDPKGAVAALTAAEMFGAVAVGAGAVAAAIPGGHGGRGGGYAAGPSGARRSAGSSGSSGSSGSGGVSGQQLVPGGNLPAAPQNGNLVIHVVGEQGAADWMAKVISTAVLQGGTQLSASHTIAIPNPIA